MVNIMILYPNLPGKTFDFDYYIETHMPMSIRLLGAHPGFRQVQVERGVGMPSDPVRPLYIAACQFTFDTLDDFVAAFSEHAELLQGDMKRYTEIEPVIQFNDIAIAQ